VVVVAREHDVSFLALTRLWTVPLLAVGYGMTPVWISYDGLAMVMDFEFFDVWLMMASCGHYVLACRSLACPITLGLYSAHVPPLSNFSMVIVIFFVCGLDYARVVCRARR